MMDRGTQRKFIKALLRLNEVLRRVDFCDGEQRQNVVGILDAVNGRCQTDFSAIKAMEYSEPLSGLANIIVQTDWQSQTSTENDECRKLCQDIICLVINKLRQEKEIKKDIVFLPYKASMWDSLESVWLAASEDKEHCNTYVIPIAYADRNSDGSASVWHCEADEFPSYVPVLDWHDYTYEKLKEMHPDVIFFHNPYDNYNAVTSVDMQYYSRNLKYCTDKLVYIPYFVMGDTISAHFCQTQGVINADYVIVQDENIKEQYERYYPGGNCPEGKILALGSPKFDKVINSKKEDFDLPESWKRIINGKKVILYNTSLTAALENTDRLCAKLRSVLNTFKGRDDVALWWRPHPLMQATLKSMRPQIAAEYEQIVAQYREEGWGIYDDSAELERAITYSDAYYGDQSSVVWLYQATGKKILIQDIADNPYAPYWFYDVVDIAERNQFLIKPPELESLFLLNADTGECIREIPLPAWQQTVTGMCQWNHCFMRRMGKEVIIYPFKSRNWYCYDIDTGKITLLYHGTREEKFLISGSIEYQDCLYFWNRGLQLWQYDPRQKKIELVGDWPEWQETMQTTLIQDAACVLHGILYIPLCSNGQVLAIDLHNYKVQALAIGSENERYINITTDGKHLWFLKDVPEIEEYDPETGAKASRSILQGKNARMMPYFVYITCTDSEKLVAFPYCEYPQATEVIRLSLQTGEIQQTEVYQNGYGMVRRIRENCIVAIDVYNKVLDVYDNDGNLLRRCQVNMGEYLEKNWYKDALKNGRMIVSEKYSFGLDSFIKNIRQAVADTIHPINWAGEVIYQWTQIHW